MLARRWLGLGLTLTMCLVEGCGGTDAKSEEDARSDEDAGHDASAPDGGNGTDDPAGDRSRLRAFVGGNSIALRWRNVRGAVKHEVLRDGAVVGSVTPGFHADFPERDGNGFIDANVEPGKTYRYQIRTIDEHGTSEPSPPLTVTQSTSSKLPTITVDATKAPDLKDWLENVVRPFLITWYPKVSEILAYPDYLPPDHLELRIDPSYDGAAYAKGTEIVAAAAFARAGQKDLGVWIHEATHVLQQYRDVPGWITEGVADWSREFILHDRDAIVRPARSYTAGYSEGSYFLDWIRATYDEKAIHRINVVGHAQTFEPAIFSELTGKDVDELWTELHAKRFEGPGAVTISDGSGECFDGTLPPEGEYPYAHAKTCSNVDDQRWTLVPNELDELRLTIHDDCLAIASNDAIVKEGTPLGILGCAGSAKEAWVTTADGKLQNPVYGLCVAWPAGGPSEGANLVVENCASTAAVKIARPK